MLDIEKGKLFIISTGEYASHNNLCIAEALMDLQADVMQKEYEKIYPRKESYNWCEDRWPEEKEKNVIKWMVNKGYIKLIIHNELNLGSQNSDLWDFLHY